MGPRSAPLSPGMLAPAPDFRWVGLGSPPLAARDWVENVLVISTGAAVGLTAGIEPQAVALASLTMSAAALVISRVRSLRASGRTRSTNLAIVPWGVLVDPDGEPRILRWAAIRRVRVETCYGRDQGTPTTRFSLVRLETEQEQFVGVAAGAVGLERLLAHLELYAAEQAHAIALDLDGASRGEGPLEPDCEPLLASARAWVESAHAARVLELPAAYRTRSGRFSPRTLEVVGSVLRDRTEHAVDPRAFAAVVAGELGLVELASELIALVQSPHPVVAAVARASARRLGVATSKVGALDEVAPFLSPRDYEILSAWSRTLHAPLEGPRPGL